LTKPQQICTGDGADWSTAPGFEVTDLALEPLGGRLERVLQVDHRGLQLLNLRECVVDTLESVFDTFEYVFDKRESVLDTLESVLDTVERVLDTVQSVLDTAACP